MITDKEIYQTADDEKQQDWNDKAYEAIYKDGFIDGAKWARAKQVSVEPVVKPACEFTDKQLDIISLAVEKWLIEDTFINYNGKHGQHFIDKINGNPTLKDRLLELSKSV